MEICEFTVTRQSRWDDGVQIVEINQGSLDYANPDMLCSKYPDEGQTFTGMVPAVEAAISIAKAWQKDEPNEEIFIASGFTHGATVSFEEEPADEETFKQFLKDAREFDEKLPCCAHCGELLGKKRYGCPEFGEYDCCSEYCAEQHYYSEEEDEDG